MNPKLQASGRLGGKAGKGQAKVRPLSPSKASEMARARWDKVPRATQGHVLACRCDACENLRMSLMDNQDAKRNAANGPGSDFDASGAIQTPSE